MRHIKAFSIKFGFTTLILISGISMFQGITVQQIIIISFMITGISYFLGDLVILPTFNNFVVSIIDFGFIFLGVWLLFGFIIGQSVSLVIASTVITYILTACEALFHMYMYKKVFPKKQAVLIPFPNRR